MNREKMQQQSANLRNKKSLRLKAPQVKPKVKNGVLKVDSFSTKKKVDKNNSKDLTQKQKAARTMAAFKEARSRQKTGGCGGCRRNISK